MAAQRPEKPSTLRGTGTEKSPGPSKTTTGGILDILGSNANPEARELLLTWGKLCDQPALILFDSGATDNFISHDLAMRMGIKTEELGRPLDADQIFQEEPVHVTPLIRKLRIHIQEYVDRQDFLISPLKHYDAVLGTPWFHHKKVQIVYPHSFLKFIHRGKEVQLEAKKKGETIPLVNGVALGNSIKSFVSVYLVFVKDKPVHSFAEFNNAENQKLQFLEQFQDCFFDALPGELPLERPKDHGIDLSLGSEPPNRPPYKVSAAQRKEILT